ncbi:MAG: hypothetical protein F4Y26_07590 [Gammaproteobacteria bacterium]|nr:hypothetical protein [Gammaproteobacteria bacterium]
MSEFKRGLKDDFVSKLNELYGEGTWWKEMVNDADTFVAIRDNYVNVYYRGASLARVEPSADGVKAHVHYKYLLDPAPWRDDEYVRVDKEGEIDWGRLGQKSFPADSIDVRALKAVAGNYAGEEKTGVHKIAVIPDNAVVDVEIAISDGSRARRVDIAALVYAGDVVEVRFFEAKAFSNSELRAKGIPDVVEQIEAYGKLLNENRDEVVRSYRTVCDNLANLKGLYLSGPRQALINAVVHAEKPLVLDEEPWLVVFGFDDDQRRGRLERELKKLGEVHKLKAVARGDAKNVRLTS